MYRGELSRFSRGIYGALKLDDPAAYRLEEIKFLREKTSNKPEHVRKSVNHIEKSRQKQIIIFIDNADQRDYETQQSAFLIAQDISANWSAIVFLPIRPETFHRSVRSGGALSGYHARAFTIHPPRIDRVLQKRISFALKISQGEIPVKKLQNTNVILSNLQDILKVILESFNNSQDSYKRSIPEAIENLSGGNVRLALDILKVFLGSGHVNTKKIIDIYRESGRYTIAPHEFLRAIIYGDQVYYDPNRSIIANLFDVTTQDPREHFLMPIALSQLEYWLNEDKKDGYIENIKFYNHLQGLGYTVSQVDQCLIRAENHKLIEFSSRQSPTEQAKNPPSLRVTAIGLYHVQRLISLFAYIDAVTVDMPIIAISNVDTPFLQDASTISERADRALLFCDYLDEQWTKVTVAADPFDWAQISENLHREIRRLKERF